MTIDVDGLRRDVDLAKLIGRAVKLKKNGRELEGLCPFHREKTPSFRVVPEKRFFHCFGCGAHGDCLEFVMRFDGVDFKEAARRLGAGEAVATAGREAAGPAPEPVDIYAGYVAADPPADALELFQPGKPTPKIFNPKRAADDDRWAWGSFTPTLVHPYRSAAGDLLGFVLRRDFPVGDRGGKETPTIRYVMTPDGELCWARVPFEELRPLYGLDRLAARPAAQVIVVEGEKACDAGARILPACVFVTWPGGAAGYRKIDWAALAGRSVLCWPDADAPGMQAMHGRYRPDGEYLPGIAEAAVGAGALRVKVVDALLPNQDGSAPDKGWDAADAEIGGWTSDQVMAWVKARTSPYARPAPPAEETREAPPEPAAEPPAAEAQDDPASDDAVVDDIFQTTDSKPAAPREEDEPRGSSVLEYGNTDSSAHFTILGYDQDDFYVYQHHKKQILKVSPSDFGSDHKLNNIARLKWWQETFKGRAGTDKASASDWFIASAHDRGIFDPTMIRGRGAWIDDGRQVFHFGNKLMVDGDRVDVHKIKSEFVYPLGRKLPMPAATSLSDADAKKIIEVAQNFRWVKPGSGLLLAGWVALAPLCGAMRWRPHAWLTGGAGCGKSYILREFVKYLMSGVCLMVQGNSTEAGIRQKLKGDAIPVLFDESEQNNERDVARIQGVLSLARQASTESDALTLKGTMGGDSMEFLIRSMFCLSSIQVGIKQQADHDRIAKLELRPKREAEHKLKWPIVKAGIFALHSDKTLPARLVNRSLDLLPITLQNIEIFAEVAAQRLGAQREGDQYGTLLAGAWSLMSSGLVTRPEAEALIDQYDWSNFLEESDTEESTKALNVLLGQRIRMQNSAEMTVFELVSIAAGVPVDGVTLASEIANAILKRHGMKVLRDRGAPMSEGKLLFENGSAQIEALLEGSQFQSGWRDQLLRAEGAERHANADGKPKKERFGGLPMGCIFLKLSSILPDAGGDQAPTPDDEDIMRGGDDEPV